MNYLGIDWGEKRIGLAMADSETNIALPFKTVNNISEILDIITKEDIDVLIIGHPQKMSNSLVENPSFDKFVEILKTKLSDRDIKIKFIDERLSSVSADKLEDKKFKHDRDSVSAMIILQSYLDKEL